MLSLTQACQQDTEATSSNSTTWLLVPNGTTVWSKSISYSDCDRPQVHGSVVVDLGRLTQGLGQPSGLYSPKIDLAG